MFAAAKTAVLQESRAPTFTTMLHMLFCEVPSTYLHSR